MKKIFALIAMTCVINSYANNACMDNSWHLKRAFDNKEYHHVVCSCPCAEYPKLADRAQCTKCRHSRDPRPFVIIKNVAKQAVATAPTMLDNNAEINKPTIVPSAMKRRATHRSRAYAKEMLFSPRSVTSNFVE